MSIRQQLRYRFDNLMARGVLAQVLLLAVATGVLVALTVVMLVVFGVVPEDETTKEPATGGMMVWKALMHALDAGSLGEDKSSWTLMFIMLFITIGGLFVLSALIGVLNQGFGQLIENLRRGRSVVIERRHTVILGWTPKIHTLLSELVEANRNQRGACVVILANRDKVGMDAEVAASLGRVRLRVVTRTGNPMSAADLALVSVGTSRAVIVLAPETDSNGATIAAHESDTVVLKTLLALAKAAPEGVQKLHVVAEIFDARTEAVARMVTGPGAALILATPLISRLLVQTGRQSGLSVVYTELLDFAGAEIYIRAEPALAGVAFRDAVHRYGTSSLIGVLTATGETLLPPPLDRAFATGDRVIAISDDDDTVLLDGDKAPSGDGAMAATTRPSVAKADRTLVLGVGTRLQTVLAELGSYVAPGSEIVVVGETACEPVAHPNIQLTTRVGDVTDRGVLESLAPADFDHVLVLSETIGRTQEMADARTTVTLLHLRDLARIAGKKIPITSEILEIGNRDLATISEADDFIVSNTLISLIMSQVAENPHLIRVFDELFSAEGHEIYLKPASDYLDPGSHSFALACEAALRRGHVAIGYRLASASHDAAAAYGVVINPPKRARVTLGTRDKLIVLAEN